MARTPDDKNGSLGFEDKLWAAADVLRNNMDPAEYKHVVLGLIFQKYISDAFEERRAQLVATGDADLVDCMVALPGQLFCATQIRVCLWLLARDKGSGKLRSSKGEVLFTDARKLGRMETRGHRVPDAEAAVSEAL